MSQRYSVKGLVEAQFEPGSRNRVLRNLLRIKGKRAMDQAETQAQLRALDELLRVYDRSTRFTAEDVCKIHKLWLGDIYEWAGQYRRVNLSKGDFPFATAHLIPQLMMNFQEGPLRTHTPCRFKSESEVAKALAVVHTELILIHPFREGNGRLARLLAILMALQADLPILDFGGIRGKKRNDYFAAVRAGLNLNYEPMEKIFVGVIRRTLSKSGQ